MPTPTEWFKRSDGSEGGGGGPSEPVFLASATPLGIAALLTSVSMGAPGEGTSFADFANTLRRLQDDAAPQWNDIKNLDPETISKLKSLGLDLTQFGLDIAGIFDPTPTSDGIGTLFSLGRRDWFGAGASAFSAILPYAGDLAKASKFGKYVKSVAEAIELAKTSEKARVLMTPIFRQLDTLIDVAKKVPYSQIESKALATYNRFEQGRPWMMLTRVSFGINPKAVIRSAYDEMMKHLDDAQRQIDGFLLKKSVGLKGLDFERWIFDNLGGRPVPGRPERQIDGILPDGTWYEAKSGFNYLFDPLTGNLKMDKWSELTSQLTTGRAIAAKAGAPYGPITNVQPPQQVIDWLAKRGIAWEFVE